MIPCLACQCHCPGTGPWLLFFLLTLSFQWLKFYPEKSNCSYQASQILTERWKTCYLTALYLLFPLPGTLFFHPSIHSANMETKETEKTDPEALPHISAMFTPWNILRCFRFLLKCHLWQKHYGLMVYKMTTCPSLPLSYFALSFFIGLSPSDRLYHYFCVFPVSATGG